MENGGSQKEVGGSVASRTYSEKKERNTLVGCKYIQWKEREREREK